MILAAKQFTEFEMQVNKEQYDYESVRENSDLQRKYSALNAAYW